MLETLSTFLEAWALMAVFFAVLWKYAEMRKEADIVDVGWAFGVAATAIFFAVMGSGYPPRRTLVAALIGLWGVRLGLHLLFSRALKPGEDGRYQALRAKWGERASKKFFSFFQLQALSVVILAMPAYLISEDYSVTLAPHDVLAIVIWLVAILGEATADFQLAAFKGRPGSAGKTCREGLWAWSRHPNYFFEWLHWWTYVALGADLPFSFLLLINPVLMLFLITKVTGIPPTEARALETRGDDYRDYQRTTSAFFPLPPKRK